MFLLTLLFILFNTIQVTGSDTRRAADSNIKDDLFNSLLENKKKELYLVWELNWF